MAGHRRRASTSSVETVDESDIQWRQETSVLRSVSRDTPSDDWPVFELVNAVVLGKDGQTMENALLCKVKGPLLIRGHLVIDDPSQKCHLIMRVRASTPLEIRNSRSYAIGESSDGKPLVWVSGQGGWYEINPSPAYKPIYNKMCEATVMYYKIMDIYLERSIKRSKKPKGSAIMDELRQLFHKYAARIGDGSTLEDVIARAHEHAAFFLDKFSSEATFDWTSTAFSRWIKSEHADLAKQVQANPEKSQEQKSASGAGDSLRENARARSRHSSAREDTPTATTSSQGSHPKGKAFKVRASEPADVKTEPLPLASSSPPVAAKQSESGVEVKTMTPQRSEPAAEPTMQPKTAREIIPHYVWSERDHDASSPFQAAMAAFEHVTKAANGPKKKAITISGLISSLYFAFSFPSYREAGRGGAYKQPIQEWLHYYSRAFLRVLDDSYRTSAIYPELERLAQTDLIPMAYKPSDFPMVVAMRKPKTSVSANTPSTPTIQANDSAVSTPKPRGKQPTRTPGNKSVLRPVSTPGPLKKRPRDEFESDFPDAESPAGHRPHSFDDDDVDDMDLDVSAPNQGDDESDESDGSPFGIEPIKLVIRAERIPDSLPRGPDDTWTCEEDGCDYIVRDVDEDTVQERIRQHFCHHEQQLARVNLAMAEGKRGHMPINHLLDRIKQLSGPEEVQPIKRKLIV